MRIPVYRMKDRYFQIVIEKFVPGNCEIEGEN